MDRRMFRFGGMRGSPHDPALHAAAKSGKVDEVHRLLGEGACMNIHDEQGYNGGTPLYRACENGHLEVAKLLLSSGAEVEMGTHDSATPLHIASGKGHLEIVQLLVSSGANVKAAHSTGFTPLHIASDNGRLEVVRLLLSKGANLEARDEGGMTPLHMASGHGRLEVAKLLLSSGAQVDAPLKANPSVVRERRAARCRPRYAVFAPKPDEEMEEGSTPLHMAAINGHLELAQLLLDSGAQVDAADEEGTTPLHLATRYKRKQVAELLRSRGAKDAAEQ